MLAVDTNVLIRFFTKDDLPQSKIARDLLTSEQIWVSRSVCLETEWVLRSLYDYTSAEVAGALSKLALLPKVHLEDQDLVLEACEWHQQGLDFADAVHLASSARTGGFATFDVALAKRAAKLGIVKVRLLKA